MKQVKNTKWKSVSLKLTLTSHIIQSLEPAAFRALKRSFNRRRPNFTRIEGLRMLSNEVQRAFTCTVITAGFTRAGVQFSPDNRIKREDVLDHGCVVETARRSTRRVCLRNLTDAAEIQADLATAGNVILNDPVIWIYNLWSQVN